jgi:hypothetical protein
MSEFLSRVRRTSKSSGARSGAKGSRQSKAMAMAAESSKLQSIRWSLADKDRDETKKKERESSWWGSRVRFAVGQVSWSAQGWLQEGSYKKGYAIRRNEGYPCTKKKTRKTRSDRAIPHHRRTSSPTSSGRQPVSPLRYWLALGHVGVDLTVHVPAKRGEGQPDLV